VTEDLFVFMAVVEAVARDAKWCTCVQAETEVAALTKRVRALEEDFEATDARLAQTQIKLEQASKAADDSERFAHLPARYLALQAIGLAGEVLLSSVIMF